MKSQLNDIEKADVAKLHNEVNQLRNHELLINSFAIAMVAVILSAIDNSIVFRILILLFLIAIHYLQYTLLDIRTRITTYLDVCEFSAWERDYRKISDVHHKPSMRIASIFLFIVLSLIVIIKPMQSINEWYVAAAAVVLIFLYSCFGYLFVIVNWCKDQEMKESLKGCNKFDLYLYKDSGKKSIDAVIIERYKNIWREKLGIKNTEDRNPPVSVQSPPLTSGS